MSFDPHSFAMPASREPASGTSAVADSMAHMAGLMSRLLQDPESDAVVMPQLQRLSETMPAGPAKGAVESSVAAMSQLRVWLRQLQDRQRMHNRFVDITGRLSRVEGLPALMRALAEEARRVVDAPLARIEAFAPLADGEVAAAARASSGEGISRWTSVELQPSQGLLARVTTSLAPFISSDVHREIGSLPVETEFEQQTRLEGIHGLILLPLVLDGRCAGVLMLGDRMMRPWAPMELEALQQLATVAVRAIRRMAKAEAAQQALQALHHRPQGARVASLAPSSMVGRLAEAVAVADVSTHPLMQLLSAAPQEAQQAFIDQTIGRLLQADLTRGAPLALTLLTYMAHGHNARAAARTLGVHVNTLHNRLESIGGVLPGWDEPGRCLDVHLALRLALGPVELKDTHAGA